MAGFSPLSAYFEALRLSSAPEQSKVRFQSLLDSMTYIRLITLQPSSDVTLPLHCTMESAKRNEHYNGYKALSYTWGDATGSNGQCYINIDGLNVEIRENLWKALGAIRHRILPIKLWVDAICINQEEIEERNAQVSIMSEIYAHAQTVLVWLGDDGGSSEALFDSIQKCNETCFYRPPHSMEYFTTKGEFLEKEMPPRRELSDLIALNNRPYWSRAWIRQELFFSQSVMVFCGKKVIPWEHLKWLCCRMDEVDKHNQQVSILMNLMGVTSKFDMLWAKEKMPMLELIQSLHDGQCLIPHDRIFSLLSMASDEPLKCGLKIDYRTPFEELVVKTVAFSSPRVSMGLIELLAKGDASGIRGMGPTTPHTSPLYACAEFMWSLFEKGVPWPDVMSLPYIEMKEHFLGMHKETRGTCHACFRAKIDKGLA